MAKKNSKSDAELSDAEEVRMTTACDRVTLKFTIALGLMAHTLSIALVPLVSRVSLSR